MHPSARLEPTSNGRDANGRFTKGNPGGPGNPFARQVAALRKLMVQCATPAVMETIVRKLVERAQGGDLRAIHLLLTHTLGKPVAQVDPDRLDLEEWKLFTRVAAMPKLCARVLNASPGVTMTLELARDVRALLDGELDDELDAELMMGPIEKATPAPSANGGNGETPAGDREQPE